MISIEWHLHLHLFKLVPRFQNFRPKKKNLTKTKSDVHTSIYASFLLIHSNSSNARLTMPFSVPGKFSNLQFNFPRSSWRRVTRHKLYKYLYLTFVYCFQTPFTCFLNSYDGIKCSVYRGIFVSFLFFQAKRPQNGVQVQGNFESIQTYIKINNNPGIVNRTQSN